MYEREFNLTYAEAAREPVELWDLPDVDHTKAIHERPAQYELVTELPPVWSYGRPASPGLHEFLNASRAPGSRNQGAGSGCRPDVAAVASRQAQPMARYLLHHRHDSHDCGVVFAAFKGHESPLRHQPTLASCRSGGHAIWWTVDAATAEDALGLLPFYVSERTTATSVSEVEIP